MLTAASTAAWLPAMPTEMHDLPTVLGPLSGAGNKTFTMTVRPGQRVSVRIIASNSTLLSTGIGMHHDA
jgi:hypothetical protein